MPVPEKESLKALNDHIASEMSAGYRYLAASAYFAGRSLEGMAAWMRRQAQEELGHAMKFYDHILERGGTVSLREIPAPPSSYKDAADVFRQALKTERSTTQRIHRLYGRARDKDDFALQIFLQWFVEEQVKEEDAIGRIVDRLELAGEDRAALLLLDKELGSGGPPAS